jgi:hypothetical protein
MQRATDGIDAAALVVTVRWQNVQSMPMSWTWTVWGNAMGWSGPSFNPKTVRGRPSQAERTNAAITTVTTVPERPAKPKSESIRRFFLVRAGGRKSPLSNGDVS